MKKILFLLYKNNTHSLYKHFIFNPPDGYEYVFLDDIFNYNIYSNDTNIIKSIFNKIKRNKLIINQAIKNKIDLIYSADGQLIINNKIPWIIDFEHIGSMMNHNPRLFFLYKHIIQLILSQKTLKKIIPWTEAGEKSLIENLKFNEKIKEKIEVISLCKKNYRNSIKYKLNSNEINLLFVTSINFNGEGEFYSKGGPIVIKVFQELEKQGFNVKLTIRGKIPQEFNYIKSINNIKIYEDILENNEFSKIFEDANIFLFPGYQSPGMAFIDALEYGLPIITNKVFSNSEHVINNYNGFLVNNPDNWSAFHWEKDFNVKLIPNGTYSKTEYVKISNNEMYIEEFVDKIIYIFENQRLNDFSRNSRELFEKKFTLNIRNQKLCQIYNTILNN